MAWAVNVAVVSTLSFVLECGGVDGDSSCLLLWGLVDIRVVSECRFAFLGEELGDSRSEGGLPVINMA